MIKVVFDLNVFIPSILSMRGVAHKLVELALDGEIKIFTSEDILKELEEKLTNEFRQSEELVSRQLALIRAYAEVVEPTCKVFVVQDDSEDDKIIECAITTNVKYIISWDNHLRKIKSYKSVVILTPAEFMNKLRRK